MISVSAASMASAMAESAAFFASVELRASARAARRERRPISSICAAKSPVAMNKQYPPRATGRPS